MRGIKAFGAAAAVAFLLAALPVLPAMAAEQTNFAEGAKAEACGFYLNEEAPEMAVDGTVDTKWCCTERHAELSGEDYIHWLLVDLGEKKTVNKIMIKNASAGGVDHGWLISNLQKGKVQYSNDKENWTDIVTIDNPDRVEILKYFIDPTEMRYVRLLCSVVADEDENARLPEFMVLHSTEDPANPDTEAEELDDDENLQPGELPDDTQTEESDNVSENVTGQETSASSRTPVAPSSRTVPSEPEEDTMQYAVLIGIGAAVLVIAFIIVLIVLLRKKKPEPEGDAAEPEAPAEPAGHAEPDKALPQEPQGGSADENAGDVPGTDA